MKPESLCRGTDGFKQLWENLKGVSSAPFCLIGRVVGKVHVEMATIVLVTPAWQGQPWCPKGTIKQYSGSTLTPKNRLFIAECRLPKTVLGKKFAAEKYQIPEEKAQSIIMNWSGESGIAGVVNRLAICFVVV